MAGSVNKVILIGNLGADPEIKSFQNGGKIANIRIATSENWKDRMTGERKERSHKAISRNAKSNLAKFLVVTEIPGESSLRWRDDGEKSWPEVLCERIRSFMWCSAQSFHYRGITDQNLCRNS